MDDHTRNGHDLQHRRVVTEDQACYTLGLNNDGSGITAGPDKTMWFTAFRQNPFGPVIGRLDPSTGAVSWYPYDGVSTNSIPGGITHGPGLRQLWFGDGPQIGNVRRIR